VARHSHTRARRLITAENSVVRPSPGEQAEPASLPLRSGLRAALGGLAAAGARQLGALSRKRDSGENAAPQQPRPPQPPSGQAKVGGAAVAKNAYDFAALCGKCPCAASPLARALALARAPPRASLGRRLARSSLWRACAMPTFRRTAPRA